MEQEVTSTVLVQGLDPVDSTLRGVNQCHVWSALANQEGVDSDIVGADPEGVDGLSGVETQGAVLLQIEEQRKLALEERRERPVGQVVRARCASLREGVQGEVAISRRVRGPGSSMVTCPVLRCM